MSLIFSGLQIFGYFLMMMKEPSHQGVPIITLFISGNKGRAN